MQSCEDLSTYKAKMLGRMLKKIALENTNSWMKYLPNKKENLIIEQSILENHLFCDWWAVCMLEKK